MIKKALFSRIRRIKTTSLSNFPRNNVNLPELKIFGGGREGWLDCIFHRAAFTCDPHGN